LCVGGLDLNPKVLSCGYSGLVFGLMSFKTLIVIIVLAAIIYYGWNYIEEFLIILPIPDPKDMKEKVLGIFFRNKDDDATKKPD